VMVSFGLLSVRLPALLLGHSLGLNRAPRIFFRYADGKSSRKTGMSGA